MLEFGGTLLAALIGAVIGSVGAVYVKHLLNRRTELVRRREALVQHYLFQIQDSAETLWHRIYNLAFRGGKGLMGKTYYETTTLYALGKMLATERILAVEGVYPQLNAVYPELGDFLWRERFDERLEGIRFNKYDRIALAEAVTEREEGRFRTSTFLEFKKRYEADGSIEREWLKPASDTIKSLTLEKEKELLDALFAIAEQVSRDTGVSTSSELLPADEAEKIAETSR